MYNQTGRREVSLSTIYLNCEGIEHGLVDGADADVEGLECELLESRDDLHHLARGAVRHRFEEEVGAGELDLDLS